MNGPALVADHLDDRIDAVIAAWHAALKRNGDVPRAESLTLAEFVDHVPELIDRMAERLRGHAVDIGPEAEKHGRTRWRQGYDVAEVVAEMGHLRTALTNATFAYALENDFGLAEIELAYSAIDDVLNKALTESVRQFQEDSLGTTAAALAQAETRRSEAVLAQVAAELERAKLRTILDNLPVGVWVVDRRGVVRDCNREAERLRQCPDAEVIDRLLVRFRDRDLRADGDPGTPDSHDEMVHQEEVVWQQPEGPRIVTQSAAPLLDAAGGVSGAVVVVQDITDRKRLETDLASASAQLKAIVEQSPALIWRAGLDASCDYFNQTWLDFRGRTLEQERGDGWTQGVHPDDLDRVLEARRLARTRREPFEISFRLLRRDGQYRWIADRGAPYHDAHGRCLGHLGSCIDITERIDLETSLEQQRLLAEESSQHKGRLLSALSHDARTPLNAVFLSAQLLEMHVKGHPEPEVQECLRTIRYSVRNVLDLLSDLLNLSKIDAGAAKVEPSLFDLGQTVAECFSSIETQARQKGLDCRLELDPLEGLALWTDRAKLKQIISNLLSNALRFTERGGIAVRGARSDHQVRIAVEDTGVGIAPTDQERVFDEFATLSNPHRPLGEGTGLGLAICRRLANLLQGEIRLESAPGRGSTFTLVLPDSIVVAGSSDEIPVPMPDVSANGGPILVVEDHLTSRQALARVLKHMGYRVLEAGNGRDALDQARRERPRAVLMDVNMPVMDGVDATRAFRADPSLRNLPIFALTGDVSLINQHRIGEAGVDGYLEKPVTPEALDRALAMLQHRSR